MKSPHQPSAPRHSADAAHLPRGFMVWTRNKFLAGLALVTPLVVTFWILQFVYTVLHGWSEPLLKFFADLANELAGSDVIQVTDPTFVLVTRFVGVLIPVVFVISLGVMATNVIGARIVTAVERLVTRIPFISFIYKSLKQVIDAFKGFGGKQNFKRVAYIDYPVPGMRLIGFVTGQFCDAVTGRALTSVFLPTAPNPMTGFVLVVDSDKVTDASLSMEDGMKMIFSGGLVGPSSTVPPLNLRTPTPEMPASAPEEAETQPDGTDDETAQSPLPRGLPRAEDFDSGDPDILATASEVDDSLLRSSRSYGKKLLGALTLKKRP